MRLFIIRHADPDYPNNTITPAGHLEAKALAVRMKRLKPDQIFTSPLGRAQDTARYTADALSMTPIIQPWMAELSWPGFSYESYQVVPWDLPGHVIHQSSMKWTHDNWHTFPPLSKPEYLQDFKKLQAASDSFLAQLGYHREGGAYRVVKGHREKIAIFCHGGFGLTWLSHLLLIPLPLMWAGFVLPTSSVTTVLFDERGEGLATPRCLGVGDISHLYEAGLPMQPAGIKANME